MLAVGDMVSEFRLPDMNRNPVSLSELTAGKPALIALFKISCPVCQLTFPFLERMAHTDKLAVIGISQDGPEATEEFRSEFGVTFPTLLDEAKRGYAVSNQFGIVSVPSLFMVEPDGKISMAVAGFSKADLEEAGKRAGVETFRDGEKVPAFKPG